MLPVVLLAILTVPGDHPTIQQALDAAGPGDEVVVSEAGGPYFERVVFPVSGSQASGFITLRNAAGERPVIDGTGVPGDHLVTIDSKSWVRIQGFELRNNLGVNDGSAVRVAQLHADTGACWEARYATPRKATAEIYKARSD